MVAYGIEINIARCEVTVYIGRECNDLGMKNNPSYFRTSSCDRFYKTVLIRLYHKFFSGLMRETMYVRRYILVHYQAEHQMQVVLS